MRLTTSEISACLGLKGYFGDSYLEAVATDSRECQPGSLFVCIRGERVDGHDFAQAAMERGAKAIIAERPIPGIDVPVLVVEDSIRALGRLAQHWRSKTSAKVICITGTAGKTTLKETLASILSLAGKTAKSEKNHNNQIGLPQSILATEGDEAFWVMEAGISHEGDMDELGSIIRPDMAVILNVGCGHVAGLGGKGVAWHKTRLLKYLRPGGMALCSADYPDLVEECRQIPVRTEFFSIHGGSSARYFIAGADFDSGAYTLDLSNNLLKVETPFTGEYGAENALAACAAAAILGVENSLVAQGMANTRLPEQRFNSLQCGQWHIIDDSYNANPLSMTRMLDAASLLARKKNCFFAVVLGEMGELGKEAPARHRELGKQLARLRPDVIFWKGGNAMEVLHGLAEGSEMAPKFYQTEDSNDFVSKWSEVIAPEKKNFSCGTIIFKGSHFNALDKYVQAFINLAETERGRDNVL